MKWLLGDFHHWLLIWKKREKKKKNEEKESQEMRSTTRTKRGRRNGKMKEDRKMEMTERKGEEDGKK